MKIAYHQPSLDTIYAHRTIFHGYGFAFTDMGHDFTFYTAGMDLEKFLQKEQPDIFITSSHFFHRKQIDYGILKRWRSAGMKTAVKIDYWNSPIRKSRINEAPSLKNDSAVRELMDRDLLGDIFFHVVEQDDARMQGFAEATGKQWHTIPLAADKRMFGAQADSRFGADISFIGTNLPAKRAFFKEYVFPLGRKYGLRLYGQDWTVSDRALAWVQRAGQYMNIPLLRSLRKPKLRLEDEPKIYRSSLVSINAHEDYQKSYGGDCNERTFKIPLCGGFEITDDVACIRRYFKAGKEMVIAEDKSDWFEKIDYYIRNPHLRGAIIEAGQARVLSDHTYHNRACKIMELCK